MLRVLIQDAFQDALLGDFKGKLGMSSVDVDSFRHLPR